LGRAAPGTLAWVGGWGLDGKYPTPTLQISEMRIMQDDHRLVTFHLFLMFEQQNNHEL